MKNTIQLHIPKPCHENWDTMTPVAQGKFCASCSKDVVDFSLLTDAEVLNFFKKSTGNTCGRFHTDQLQRPLQETKIEKKKGWQWFLATITSLVMISKTNAQKKNTPAQLGKVAAVVETPKLPVKKVDTARLTGEVVAVGDTVVTKKPAIKKKIPTTGQGTVKIITPKNATLRMEIAKDTSAIPSIPAVIEKSLKNTKQSEPALQCFTAIAGGISIVTTPKKTIQTLITPAPGMVRKLLDTLKITGNAFKIYPNPIPRNSSAHVTIKESGDYQFELFDNNSRVLHVQQNTTSTKNQSIGIQLPEGLSAGMYYLRMVGTKTKKSYIDKIIVQ